METIKNAIINIIISRPINAALLKASSDYIFSSVYIFLAGLAVIGIVNLSLKINKRKNSKIVLINTILSVILILAIALANIMFYFIRN